LGVGKKVMKKNFMGSSLGKGLANKTRQKQKKNIILVLSKEEDVGIRSWGPKGLDECKCEKCTAKGSGKGIGGGSSDSYGGGGGSPKSLGKNTPGAARGEEDRAHGKFTKIGITTVREFWQRKKKKGRHKKKTKRGVQRSVGR